MPSFASYDGSVLDFDVRGEGAPIVLLHGFAADRHRNWEATGWIPRLVAEGRRVVAMDARGHGASAKPHDPAAYAAMPDDALALMDHLGIGRADLMGYSMGARVAATVLAERPARFRCGVLGGVGDGLLDEPAGHAEAIARVLEADPDALAQVPPRARAFRAFVDGRGGDRRALAACMRGMGRTLDAVTLARIACPVLVVAGADDALAGDPRRLAAAIPGARWERVPGRDHLTAVGARETQEAVVRFLGEVAPAGRVP